MEFLTKLRADIEVKDPKYVRNQVIELVKNLNIKEKMEVEVEIDDILRETEAENNPVMTLKISLKDSKSIF